METAMASWSLDMMLETGVNDSVLKILLLDLATTREQRKVVAENSKALDLSFYG